MIKTTNVKSLEGIYQKQGNTLKKGNLKLRICQRKTTTTKKSEQFLVSRPKGSKGEYISSLYPISEDLYKFDYKGKKYRLSLSEDQNAQVCITVQLPYKSYDS